MLYTYIEQTIQLFYLYIMLDSTIFSYVARIPVNFSAHHN